MKNEECHKYDDIINLPHHVSSKRPPMPEKDRAAQFAPFAPLTGHMNRPEKSGADNSKAKTQS